MAELRVVHDTHLDLGASWCLKPLHVDHRQTYCLLPKNHRGRCLPPRLAVRDVSADNPPVPEQREAGE